MGLLTIGTPLDWTESKQHIRAAKERGVKEFLRIYKRFSGIRDQPFRWGDEIEFSLIKFDHANKRAYLLLKANKLIPELKKNSEGSNVVFHPEYSNYMVETCPRMPFDDKWSVFCHLEADFEHRRRMIEAILPTDEHLIPITCFPLLGCPQFSYPHFEPTPDNGASRSLFVPDQVIFDGLPRFLAITKNAIARKSRKMSAHVPIFIDKFTPRPFREQFDEAKDDHVHLDCTAFGMGCCCLQVTFQAESMNEARHLYDQLTPFTPIALALTASSPIWRGYLTNTDARWDIISSMVDDRTDEELGLKPLNENKFLIAKSRYDSIDSYLSPSGSQYNDINLTHDSAIYDELRKNGVDHLLAQHIAHIFIRDPLVLIKEKLNNLDDESDECEFFENIQSTNWQSMRFKPPPLKSDPSNPIGWRVEFRPMELQLTDFENAAFSCLVILLTHAIQKLHVNFLMPISKVDENMNRAQRIDACLQEKFHFRLNIFDTDEECQLEEMSIDEIMNGSDRFKGILIILGEYLNSLRSENELDQATFDQIHRYLDLIKSRANGSVATPASMIRKLVREHPLYKFDSVVTPEINYDLIQKLYANLNESKEK